MTKMFCSIPLGDGSVEVVSISVTDGNFKKLSDILSNRFKNENGFLFVPAIEEQIKINKLKSVSPEKKTAVIRTIWVEIEDIKALFTLRKEIAKATKDPNYTIIANYAIHCKDVEVNVDPIYSLIVYGEEISGSDMEDLKKQVECALSDPNYIIITNYEVHISQHRWSLS